MEQLRFQAKDAMNLKLTFLSQLCSTKKSSICCVLQSLIHGMNVFRDMVIQLKVEIDASYFYQETCYPTLNL